MASYGWNLPPGCPGPHATEIEVRCVNPSCDAYLCETSLEGVSEFGSAYLRRENDIYCGTCGWAMGDSCDEYPVVERVLYEKGEVVQRDNVLVDTNEDEVVLTGPHYMLEDAAKGYRAKRRAYITELMEKFRARTQEDTAAPTSEDGEPASAHAADAEHRNAAPLH